MIQFITGNANKFVEVKAVLSELEQLTLDLPESQELDPHEIIRAKREEARKHVHGEIMVEDTSLYLEGMNEFPGPLIKWFLKSLGHEGIARLVDRLDTDRATAKTLIGYVDAQGSTHFFEGAIQGRMVHPRTTSSFSWDIFFIPDGHDKTFAEMSREEKNAISMRRMAVEKLKAFLEQR